VSDDDPRGPLWGDDGLGEGCPERPRHVDVELFGDQATDVIGLDEV
jgi:hypothetical protein